MNDSIRSGLPFNPFAWGTLFFTFWLTIITIPGIGILETVIAWIYFGLSCFLWLATFVPPLDKPISAQLTRQHIMPWLFLASVTVWVISCVTSLDRIPECYQLIVLIGAVLWVVAYMCILVWNYSPAWLGTLAGAGVSTALVIRGIIHLLRTGSQIEGWALIAIGAFLLLATLLKSKIGRKFPVV